MIFGALFIDNCTLVLPAGTRVHLHGGFARLEDDEGNQYDLLNEEEVQRKKLKPGPGDMIVFAGGQIWHKVEFVQGSRPRFTIGGFMSRSKDDKTLYFWS